MEDGWAPLVMIVGTSPFFHGRKYVGYPIGPALRCALRIALSLEALPPTRGLVKCARRLFDAEEEATSLKKDMAWVREAIRKMIAGEAVWVQASFI